MLKTMSICLIAMMDCCAHLIHNITLEIFYPNRCHFLNPRKTRDGGGAESAHCAETVSNRRVKLCDFYLQAHSEYRLVS